MKNQTVFVYGMCILIFQVMIIILTFDWLCGLHKIMGVLYTWKSVLMRDQRIHGNNYVAFPLIIK